MVELTSGNKDDRHPVVKLTQAIYGKLYANKGYINQELPQELHTQGVNLIYKIRKNMTPEPLSAFDRVLLKKRTLIETVIEHLKSQTQLEYTRHRSFANFQVNMVAALVAYTHQEKKPSLNFREIDEIKEPLPKPEKSEKFLGNSCVFNNK